MRLQSLDVTENPFTYDTKNYLIFCGNESTVNIRIPSLVEWSAKSILKSRFLLFLFSFYLYCIIQCLRYINQDNNSYIFVG